MDDRKGNLRGGTAPPDRSASALALSRAASVYSTSNQALMVMLAGEEEKNLKVVGVVVDR
jgi:hypothetical protein